MYFQTVMTESVTDQDKGLLYFASISVKCLMAAGHNIKMSKGDEWKFPSVNCHSVSRLIYSLFPEKFKLADGYIVGIRKINISDRDITLQETRHSWLVTPDNAIIDPWPMGIVSPGNVLLIPTQENDFNAHGSNLYFKDESVRTEFDVRASWKTVSTVKRILGEYHLKNKNSIDETCKLVESLF